MRRRADVQIGRPRTRDRHDPAPRPWKLWAMPSTVGMAQQTSGTVAVTDLARVLLLNANSITERRSAIQWRRHSR